MDLLIVFSYILFSMLLFLIVKYLNKKFKLNLYEYIFIPLIYIIIVSMFFKFNHYIFLVSLFLMFIDIIYTIYVKETNFFSNGSIIKMYIVIVISSYLINRYLIDTSIIYLDKPTLKIIVWIFIIYFIYQFIKNKNISYKSPELKSISDEEFDKNYIILSYTKFKIKYRNIIEQHSNISNIIYAGLVYYNNIRPEYLRRIDYFKFRLNNRRRPLGIMQIDSDRFITDTESILIAISEIEKIYSRLKNKKTAKTIKKEDINYKVIKSYYKNYDFNKIIEIYDEICKF